MAWRGGSEVGLAEEEGDVDVLVEQVGTRRGWRWDVVLVGILRRWLADAMRGRRQGRGGRVGKGNGLWCPTPRRYFHTTWVAPGPSD